MISARETALLLLRSDRTDLFKPGHMPAQASNMTEARVLQKLAVLPSAEPAVREGRQEDLPKGMEQKAGEKLDINDPSIPEEFRKGMALVRAYDRPPGYEDYRQALGQPVNRAPGVSIYNYDSKVVMATALAPAEDEKWARAIEDARHKTAMLVGVVVQANAPRHQLVEIDASLTQADPVTLNLINDKIRFQNIFIAMRADYSERVYESDVKWCELAANSTRQADGQYKIGAYQIKTDDGKLVAEMTEAGHFLTYNQDGSLQRDMNRNEVCAELSYGVGCSHFGRTAALAYTDDKDLQFY